MKKIFIVLLLCFFMLPITVKADRDLDGEIKLYSEDTTVGSTVVFKYRAICGNECDEILTYDKDVLEYVSVSAKFQNWEMNTLGTPSVKVISNEPGTLKYDYTVTKTENNTDEYFSAETEILVKFKVKALPKNGKIQVTAAAMDDNGNPIEGLKNNLEIKAIGTTSETCNCPNCPKCEQAKQETTDEKECNCQAVENKECKSNNIWFVIGIISLIFNGLFLILIIILLIKKKKKIIIVDNNTSNEAE